MKIKAMDAAHDVFVELLRKKHVLHDDGISSLLYIMATNTCLNIIKKEKNNPRFAGDNEILKQIAGTDNPEDRIMAAHFLEHLFKKESEKTRLIATLYFVDKLNLEETARYVGLSVSGVWKRLNSFKKRGFLLREE
ncbi:MAG: sigma-70 family RNA polymerase sigma factor [Spirochaetota bacterium]